MASGKTESPSVPGYDFLSSIFEHALSAIVTIDERGLVTGWNPQAARLFGWTAAEAIGQPLHETIIPPAYRERHLAGFAHWLNSGEGPVLNSVIEVEGMSRDGRIFPIELAISPVVRTEGQALVIAFCRDITERRMNEAEMREAASRLHELELMQDVAGRLSFTVDLPAIYGEVVRAAAEMASAPGSELRRSSLLRIVGRRTTSVAEFDTSGLTFRESTYDLDTHPVLERVVATGESVAGRISAMPVPTATADVMSATDLVDAAVVAVRVGDEMFGLLTVSSRDGVGFTATQLQRLEAIAQIAGLAIGNAQHFQLLRQNAERAAELERAKSEFLKLASHELRGPLGLLRGYVSMMMEGALSPDDVQQVLPLLSAKLTQINDLVNQMLESSRLDDGRLELDQAEVDMCAVVREAADSHRGLLTGGATLVLDLPETGQFVDGDRARLVTVVSNLIDNAIKYSPNGGAVHCSLGTDHEVVVIRVRDDGLGIASDDLPRLFTRFGRLVTPENSHIAGTGLGLYICRRLARLHGGEITVESVVGKGSTFTLSLPRRKRGAGIGSPQGRRASDGMGMASG